MIVFRCDGDARVGAGHVARCIQVALAFQAEGARALFVGSYSGVAADLLSTAGMEVSPPEPSPVGIPDATEVAIFDSYEIKADVIERAAQNLPVVVIADGKRAPKATAVISYHLDAAHRIEVPAPTAGILGPEYAPVSPVLTTARRRRAMRKALVSMGGSDAGLAAAERAAHELLELDSELEVLVAASGSNPIGDPRVTWGPVPGGLVDLIRDSDIAVSAAGSTPYDLATAGVPTALKAIATNQEPIEAAFLAAGLAVGETATLADPSVRDELAEAGPRAIDGYGAFRVRDAIEAVVDGRPAPRVLTYRPATLADADRLLDWRNDPVAREMSRTSDFIEPDGHIAWLESVLANPHRTLLIVESERRPVGTLRFDREDDSSEISISIAPTERGSGLGSQAIAEGTTLELAARPELREVVAEIDHTNLPSLGAFERAGYRANVQSHQGDKSLLVRRQEQEPS